MQQIQPYYPSVLFHPPRFSSFPLCLDLRANLKFFFSQKNWINEIYRPRLYIKRQSGSGRPKATTEAEDNPIHTITQRKCLHQKLNFESVQGQIVSYNFLTDFDK